MTSDEQATLIYDQQISGVQNGEFIASIVIKQFPDGFTSEVGSEITAITEEALAHVIDTLTANGVEAKYRQPFADGFYIGLRNTFAEYASDCASRALRVA